MIIIITFLWLIFVVAEVRNQAGIVQLQKPETRMVQLSKVQSAQRGSQEIAAPKVTSAARTVRLVTKATTTNPSNSHAPSASTDWLIFGYNAYTIIIVIAALIIVLLICIIIALLFRRSSKAAAAPNAVDQACDGYEVGGAQDDGGGGYPPPGAKGPFKFFRSRFRGGGKMQKSYPQRPGKYSPAPYKGGGTGESQMGGAGDEEGGGEPYDQEGAGESGYGAMGQNEEAAYQEEYPPQGYGRGFKSRAPFRGGRTGAALSPKYPAPQQQPMPFQVKRKKAPYQTLKQGGGPGRFPRPPAKRGFFGTGRGGRGYGAPGQY